LTLGVLKQLVAFISLSFYGHEVDCQWIPTFILYWSGILVNDTWPLTISSNI